jgi:hypothetical protein
MVDKAEAQRLGIEASEALRAAADMLTDESIPHDQRLDAYCRCLLRHKELSEEFVKLSDECLKEQSAK